MLYEWEAQFFATQMGMPTIAILQSDNIVDTLLNQFRTDAQTMRDEHLFALAWHRRPCLCWPGQVVAEAMAVVAVVVTLHDAHLADLEAPRRCLTFIVGCLPRMKFRMNGEGG
jgi:hypothetical protein